MNDSARTTERTCPACGEGTLQARADTETVEHRGKTGELELRYTVCNHCSAELTDAEDARYNKRAMNALKMNA